MLLCGQRFVRPGLQNCVIGKFMQWYIRNIDLREAGDGQHHYVARGYLPSSIVRVHSTTQRLPSEARIFGFAERFHCLCEGRGARQVQDLHFLQPGRILQDPRRNLSEVVRRNGMLRRHGHGPIG